MIQTALEVYARGCSEFGLEARFPFLDKRLVEFCLAIPGEQKVSEGYTRSVVRRALQGYLPNEIRLRSDKGNLGWISRAASGPGASWWNAPSTHRPRFSAGTLMQPSFAICRTGTERGRLPMVSCWICSSRSSCPHGIRAVRTG